MDKDGKKTGAFIVPTGIGASIGGFAGDASVWARRFSEVSQLIVNPNVVNAGCFSGINEKMFYVEGFSLDSFFKGEISLLPTFDNKIGIVFDKDIPQDVLNVHINTINAVKTIYDVKISNIEITEESVGVDFFIDESGISTGCVKNLETVLKSAKKLIKKGANAIAIVCRFTNEESEDYANGIGVDPIGGVEAIISHYISRELKVPCAHAPAFDDYSISSQIVDARAAAEYITPTFLPCVLLGLTNAPQIIMGQKDDCISIKNLDYLIMPANALGSTPVFESIKNNIPIFAVNENKSVLNVGVDELFLNSGIIIKDTYNECLEHVKSL